MLASKHSVEVHKGGAMAAEREATVREIMTKGPITLESNDVLDLADDIIDLGRIRHLPILEKGRVVGVLSQRDLFHSALAKVLGFKPREKKRVLRTIQIREVMSRPVIAVSPDTPVKVAAHLMLAKKIGCLPVVEGEGLVGVVTETDVLRHFVEH